MSSVVLEELLVQMSVRDKEVADAFDKLDKKIDKFDDKTEKSTKKLNSSLNSIEKSVLAVGASFATVATLSGLKDVIVTFENLEASLRTIEGGAKGAEAAFDKIEKFARTTPYTLEEVTESYIKLKNLGLDPSEEALTSFGNTASAMGKSLNQMIEAVADASTGEFERLKEFGIKARTQGDKITFLFQGVRTTVKNNAADIEEYLRGIGDVQFAGAMEERLEDLNTAWSNMGMSIDAVQKAIGDKGATAAMIGFANGINMVADGWRRILELDIEEGSIAHKMGLMSSDEREAMEQQAQAIRDNEAAIQSFHEQMAMLNETGETGNNFVDLQDDFNNRDTPDGMEGKLAKLQESLLSEQELLQLDYEAKYELAQEAYANSLLQEEEYNEMRKALKDDLETSLTSIEEKERQQRERSEAKHTKTVSAMKRSAVNEAVSLLNILGSKSKGAALAALAVQKALAIGETIVSTQAASMRALAELGPIAGPPVAASIQQLGAVKVGLIAATGLAQATTMGSGGSSVGGSYSGTTGTPTTEVSQATGQPVEEVNTQQVTINLQGDSIYSPEQVRNLIEKINDEQKNGAVLEVSIA